MGFPGLFGIPLLLITLVVSVFLVPLLIPF